MTVDFNRRIRDSYLIAQYAYWAGDFAYAQECYARTAGRETSPAQRGVRRRTDDAMIEDLHDADALLAYVADKREQRIADKRRTFQTLTRSFSPDLGELFPDPLILPTTRLRGAVWRLSDREFEMRAYVSAVKHAKHVLERAKEIARERGTEPTETHTQEPPELRPYITEVFEWFESGNPFVSVLVTGLLFIEVRAFWTASQLPSSFTPIQARLQDILNSLSE